MPINPVIPMTLLQAGGRQVDPRLLRPGSAEVLGQAAAWLDGAQSSPVLLLALVAAALLVGGIVGGFIQRASDRKSSSKNRPRWPRDWPGNRDLFTRDQNGTGYQALRPRDAKGSGAMQIGRTYPRFSPIPNIYPLRGLKRRIESWFSRPVWVPYAKRFQHFSVLGATGKGKSTAYAVPVLAYGALEKETSYFVIDVKSPAFARMFSALYKAAGKEVQFIDPWSPKETLAFEPLWRSTGEERDILAEVIISYSVEASQQSSSENSEFFKVAAVRLMTGLLEATQFWPRRLCNLPCVQQLVAAGGNAIVESFQNLARTLPSEEATVEACKVVSRLPEGEVEPGGRSQAAESALDVVERSGYRLASIVRQMREYERCAREGAPHPKIGGPPSAEQMAAVRESFSLDVRRIARDRHAQLKALLQQQGEFINMAEDTRNSVVSTLTNKLSWFRDPNIARSFGRDEMRIEALVDRPSLFLVGAPMAKLKVGSLFVASILSNLATNAVFQRGMRIERGEKNVSKHGVFFLLDEFPQLSIKSAPTILATFRGFKSGLVMIFQERGQLKQLYGEDAVTMEGNTVHRVLLQGAHEDTAEFYAQKAIGEAAITKRSTSGTSGEKKNVSESVESVPLMTTQDVKAMKLNGRVMPDMALSVGAEVPAFPIKPVPYYDDPVMRDLLGLDRQLVRRGYNGKPTWKFWQWSERWEPRAGGDAYLNRQPRDLDEVADPFEQYLDYLLQRRRRFDELRVPRLELAAIGVTKSVPSAAGMDEASPRQNPGAPPEQPLDSELVPIYGNDMRDLIQREFQSPQAMPSGGVAQGSLSERVEWRITSIEE